MDKIIKDARTDKVPERDISKSIVQGVLQTTSLPTIANIVPGISKAHFGGHEVEAKGKKASVLEVPKAEQGATKMKSGSASYAGSQSKRR